MTRDEASKLELAAKENKPHESAEFGQVIEVMQAGTGSGAVTVERRTLVPLTGDWAEGVVIYRKA